MTTPEALALILRRRSASPRQLGLPAPSDAELDLMVRAAAAAPDHKQLRPFRFMVIGEERRADLAVAFRAAKRERDPGASDEDILRAGDKATYGPLLLAIILRVVRDHPRVSVSDQMLAVGAAVENMLIAASALGYGACLRSGNSATSRRVREALGLAADEDLAAFLLVGTQQKEKPPRDDDVTGLITRWE
jgi:nitroreductase